ncbi:DUF2339 domain-containing protein [bacterium]|nr:DUF2339 domain-containing protein [bacterium]
MGVLGFFLGIFFVGLFIFILALPFIVSGHRKRLVKLETQLRSAERTLKELLMRLDRNEGVHTSPVEPIVPDVRDRQTEEKRGPGPEHVQEHKQAAARVTGEGSLGSRSPRPPRPPRPPRVPVGPSPFDVYLERFKKWLFGGNMVARIGIIVIFFGVSFSLKYVAEHGWFPIELRLAGTALSGIIMVVLGWRLQNVRRGYGLVLQGGGVGVIYLTVFGAVMFYKLLHPGLGLVIMVVLVLLASLLAILQDARSLAILAATGGFLAPVLISRGGSHVHLFLYYLVLDLGILGIAWFKTWRGLNLIGFTFTFVICSIWGYRYYQPAFFATTEPFLILFALVYVAVPVLFALKQSPGRMGLVDGSLIFGVPLIAFGLQSGLVRDFEYGLAFTALSAGLFYAALAWVLVQSKLVPLRFLTEVFLALAVAFGTVAIPLAVDGRWTGSAWALEGAALVWVGLRQWRLLARCSGLLVQLGAGVAYLAAVDNPTAPIAAMNSLYLGAVMISLAGFLTAYLYFRSVELRPNERDPAKLCTLIWALLWWFPAGFHEIEIHAGHGDVPGFILLFVTLSVVALFGLRLRLPWSDLDFPVMLFTPALVMIAAIQYLGYDAEHPLQRWAGLAWPISIIGLFWHLKKADKHWPGKVIEVMHTLTLWLPAFLLTWELSWLVQRLISETETWALVIWGIIPTFILIALPWLKERLDWPLGRFHRAYLEWGARPLAIVAGLWVLISSFGRGNPSPLPFCPLLNPLELSQLVIVLVLLIWSRQHWKTLTRTRFWTGWSIITFVAVNGIIARGIHYWGHISFTMEALWASAIYQTALSIVWTGVALIVMAWANKLKQRTTWMVGATLLGAVVLKLFLVDLSGAQTVARIISFLVVGALTLLIGYLSPLPPRTRFPVTEQALNDPNEHLSEKDT